MPESMYCPNETRRTLVRNDGRFNGIDFLEVLDDESPLGTPPQQTLLVHCLKSVAALTKDNVQIEGGVRVTPVSVEWAFPADSLDVPADLQAFLTGRLTADELQRTLVVRTNERGDFSVYTLRLSLSPGQLDEPPAGFDRMLAAIDFSFKVECPSDFDCATRQQCTEPVSPGPRIDYLAKDFASFRSLMLDRLSVLVPEWTERSPADLGIALVEVLAYAADYLSYHQDAVATEAYLGTARRRVSVRRHARLLDYHLSEGASARAWLSIEVEQNSDADGVTLPASTPVLTRHAGGQDDVDAQLAEAISRGAVVFETLHAVNLNFNRNRISFYTWGDPDCCLPRGTTAATLRGTKADLDLHHGDVLILEEVRGPNDADPDPNRRHAVRIQGEPVERVDELTDPPTSVCEISWHAADALPRAFNLQLIQDEASGTGESDTATVALGNVVLADHGHSVRDEPLEPAEPPLDRPYRPVLQRSGLAYRATYIDGLARQLAAIEATAPKPSRAEPAIRLTSSASGSVSETWEQRPDLLRSDRFAREFVVEMETDRIARIRFGDGELGRRPAPGTRFLANYRIGGGRKGNVGAESLTRLVTSLSGIKRVRNPLPAVGGVDPEPLERARLHAPHAFRGQERAVTESDYAAVAQRHPEVQRAAATRRWTGSWYTMFLTVDRRGGLPVDAAFENELREFLERFRLTGVDLEIDAPRFVSLDVALRVCVARGFLRGHVAEALNEVFSARDLANGLKGFFHPDNFTFGQPVFLSRIVTAAMNVPGVEWVEAVRFQRWGQPAGGEIQEGRLAIDRLEIARLDNDSNLPENGKLEWILEGGL